MNRASGALQTREPVVEFSASLTFYITIADMTAQLAALPGRDNLVWKVEVPRGLRIDSTLASNTRITPGTLIFGRILGNVWAPALTPHPLSLPRPAI
jgi:hypothetical protein